MTKYENIIESIDTKIKKLVGANRLTTDIMRKLSDYIPLVFEIIKHYTPDELELLCQKYYGFYTFLEMVQVTTAELTDID